MTVFPPTGEVIEVDPTGLLQMAVDLLANAIKYMHEAGRVTFSASVEADMAVVRVGDDGKGIAP